MLESITKFFSLSLLELSVYDLVILVLFSLSLILTLVFALIVIATKVRKLNNDIDNQHSEQISNEKVIINYLDVIMKYLSKENFDIKSNVKIREDIKKQDNSIIDETFQKSSLITETSNTNTSDVKYEIISNLESKPESLSKNLTVIPKENNLILLEDEIKNIPFERQKLIENVAENINTLSALEQVSQQIEDKIKQTKQEEDSIPVVKKDKPVSVLKNTTASESSTLSNSSEDSIYNTSKDVGNIINIDPLVSTESVDSNVEINNQVSDVRNESGNSDNKKQNISNNKTPDVNKSSPLVRKRSTPTHSASNRSEQENRFSSTKQDSFGLNRQRPTRFINENAVDKDSNFNNNFSSRINRNNINDSTGLEANRFNFKPVSLNLLNRANETNLNNTGRLIGSDATSYNNEEGQLTMYNNTMNRSIGNNRATKVGMTSTNINSIRPAIPNNLSNGMRSGNSSMGGMGSMNRPNNNMNTANRRMGNSPVGGMGSMNRPNNNMNTANRPMGNAPMGNMGSMRPNNNMNTARPMGNAPMGNMGSMNRPNNNMNTANRPMGNAPMGNMGSMNRPNNDMNTANRPIGNAPMGNMGSMNRPNNNMNTANRPIGNAPMGNMGSMNRPNNNMNTDNRPVGNMSTMKPANATVRSSRPQLSSGTRRR